jgi:NADH:ubiquinone oxidoreductase subunit 3 (subunit A)
MNFKSTQLLTAAIFFFALIFLLLLLTLLLSSKNQTNEKVSAYECGFEPFSDARHNFQIHFYVVAILFIIFDVEIVFLIP